MRNVLTINLPTLRSLTGARGETAAPVADQETLGGQPEAAGRVPNLRRQAQEVHRVGLQHHRHELTSSFKRELPLTSTSAHSLGEEAEGDQAETFRTELP